MGMNLNNSSASTTNKGANSGNTDWKSQYFLNFALPANTASGKVFVGGVGLKVNDPAQKGLIDFILADQANLGKVRKALKITFRDMAVASNVEVTIPGVVMPKLEAKEVGEDQPQGYINIHAPMADGTEGQVGFIALRERDHSQRMLLAILRAASENVAPTLAALLMDFQSATPQKRQFAFV